MDEHVAVVIGRYDGMDQAPATPQLPDNLPAEEAAEKTADDIALDVVQEND